MTDYTGTSGNDRYTGTAGDDNFDMSQGGKDQVKAGAGDDYVYMGATFTAADRINGGHGLDEFELNGDYAAGVTFGPTTLTGVELVGLDGDHSYRLVLDDATVATGGTLAIYGNGLPATASADLDGSAESDGDLYLLGGAGDDRLIGGGGNDLFRANGGADVIDGGGGDNRISYFAAGSGLTLDLNKQGQAQDTGLGMLTLSHVESVSGTQYADRIVGDDLDNVFIANGGADTLAGNGGSDWFEVGPDVNGVVPTAVRLSGGSGEDLVGFNGSVPGGGATAGVTLSLATAKLQDTNQGSYRITGVEDADGTTFGDHIVGNSGANHLYGDGGDDVLDGGKGDDILSGDGGVRLGGPYGGPRVNYDAGPGDDTLIGGAGDDTMTGGGGADLFFFAKGSGADTITDFTTGADTIRIDVARVTSFADLTIIDDGTGGALISWRGSASVDLIGVAPGSLSASDFSFGPLDDARTLWHQIGSNLTAYHSMVA